ncbi:MAG: hypothetical protein GY832_13360 [Chloroflexi bacterium]|nr:hypothetical protein [Chloroflexota bacterium]
MDFGQVEKEVARLRQDLAAGRLTEEQFKVQLREMMVEDADGNWWMVGYETGEWYQHDGTDWVRADPLGHTVPEPTPQPIGSPALQLDEQTSLPLKPKRAKGIILLLLGLVISIALGWGLAALTYNTLRDLDLASDLANTLAFTCWGIVGLGGLILSIRVARKSWRGK